MGCTLTGAPGPSARAARPTRQLTGAYLDSLRLPKHASAAARLCAPEPALSSPSARLHGPATAGARWYMGAAGPRARARAASPVGVAPWRQACPTRRGPLPPGGGATHGARSARGPPFCAAPAPPKFKSSRCRDGTVAKPQKQGASRKKGGRCLGSLCGPAAAPQPLEKHPSSVAPHHITASMRLAASLLVPCIFRQAPAPLSSPHAWLIVHLISSLPARLLGYASRRRGRRRRVPRGLRFSSTAGARCGRRAPGASPGPAAPQPPARRLPRR